MDEICEAFENLQKGSNEVGDSDNKPSIDNAVECVIEDEVVACAKEDEVVACAEDEIVDQKEKTSSLCSDKKHELSSLERCSGKYDPNATAVIDNACSERIESQVLSHEGKDKIFSNGSHLSNEEITRNPKTDTSLIEEKISTSPYKEARIGIDRDAGHDSLELDASKNNMDKGDHGDCEAIVLQIDLDDGKDEVSKHVVLASEDRSDSSLKLQKGKVKKQANKRIPGKHLKHSKSEIDKKVKISASASVDNDMVSLSSDTCNTIERKEKQIEKSCKSSFGNYDPYKGHNDDNIGKLDVQEKVGKLHLSSEDNIKVKPNVRKRKILASEQSLSTKKKKEAAKSGHFVITRADDPSNIGSGGRVLRSKTSKVSSIDKQKKSVPSVKTDDGNTSLNKGDGKLASFIKFEKRLSPKTETKAIPNSLKSYAAKKVKQISVKRSPISQIHTKRRAFIFSEDEEEEPRTPVHGKLSNDSNALVNSTASIDDCIGKSNAKDALTNKTDCEGHEGRPSKDDLSYTNKDSSTFLVQLEESRIGKPLEIQTSSVSMNPEYAKSSIKNGKPDKSPKISIGPFVLNNEGKTANHKSVRSQGKTTGVTSAKKSQVSLSKLENGTPMNYNGFCDVNSITKENHSFPKEKSKSTTKIDAHVTNKALENRTDNNFFAECNLENDSSTKMKQLIAAAQAKRKEAHSQCPSYDIAPGFLSSFFVQLRSPNPVFTDHPFLQENTIPKGKFFILQCILVIVILMLQ